MPKILVEQKSKYNWRPDKPDARDHIFNAAAVAPAQLLPAVDLRQYDSPIQDQGQIGSCTGNAIAGLINLIDRKVNNTPLQVSRLFIYYQERVYEGTVYYDSGAYIRDGIKTVYTYGAPTESLWPYQTRLLYNRPSTAAWTDAAKRKVTGYQRVQSLNDIKVALSAGNPVVIGFTVYESFEGNANNTTGMMPFPNTGTEQILGGHAVAVVGYNDNLNGGRLICRNSWGTSWGDRGYFYMPYQVITTPGMASDFWMISAVHKA